MCRRNTRGAWGSLPQLELILISSFLRRGFVVSIADHEGRPGTFGAPREPGHRVLDGVRAALACPSVGLPTDTPVGLLGYSGGGLATAWAAEMAPSYAPELDVVGAVLGSPVGDPGVAFTKLNGGPYAGLPALVVAGLRHVYPGLASVVRQHATLEGMRRLRRLEKLTTLGATLRYAFDDFDDYLDSPLADVLATPEVLELFDDLRLGKHAPTCPVLVMQSRSDQIVDVREVDELVDAYVDGDAEVLYVRDRISEHLSLALIGFPLSVGWLESRFRSGGGSAGRRDVLSLALSPKSWPGYLRMVGSLGRTVTGAAG